MRGVNVLQGPDIQEPDVPNPNPGRRRAYNLGVSLLLVSAALVVGGILLFAVTHLAKPYNPGPIFLALGLIASGLVLGLFGAHGLVPAHGKPDRLLTVGGLLVILVSPIITVLAIDVAASQPTKAFGMAVLSVLLSGMGVLMLVHRWTRPGDLRYLSWFPIILGSSLLVAFLMPFAWGSDPWSTWTDGSGRARAAVLAAPAIGPVLIATGIRSLRLYRRAAMTA